MGGGDEVKMEGGRKALKMGREDENDRDGRSEEMNMETERERGIGKTKW